MSFIRKFLFAPRESTFGPIVRVLKYICVWRPNSSRKKTILFYSHLTFDIIYSLNLTLNLILNYEFYLFLNFVNYSAFFLSPTKISQYAYSSKKWKVLVDLVEGLEEDSTRERDSECTKIITRHRVYSHLVLIGFWGACLPIVVFMFICYWFKDIIIYGDEPVEDIRYIFKALLPFDQNTIKGRYLSATLQTFFGFISPVHTLCWDSLALASMVFLVGQLKALKVRCINALDCEDEETRWRNLLTCYHMHVRILKLSTLLNELISVVMSIYLLQVLINCAICVIKIIIFKDDKAEVIATLDLLYGINMQLLLFYWIANEVTVQSLNLSYGVFESNWVSDSKRIRCAVFIMGMGMTRRIAFNAGPFNEMSLATFIGVLKSSYSFYTLLSRSLNLTK